MTLIHDYRYDLRVHGADEQTLAQFSGAFERSVFIDCMLQDPYDSELFSTEACETSGNFREETVEEALHSLSMQFPSLKLHFTAEDLDAQGKGYELIFQGNMYQRCEYYTAKSDFTPPVPFEDRLQAIQNARTFETKPRSTKEMAMSLYKQMLETHNTDNAAYYIAKNLAYLAQTVEPPEEIPLDVLYQISERLHEANGYSGEPLLNEERLDAIRVLLEKGIVITADNDLECEDVSIQPAEVPAFLINCNIDAFLYAVETTAFSNQELYCSDTGIETQNALMDNLLKELASFKRETSRLTQKISDAEQRKQEGPEPEHEIGKGIPEL